MMDEETFKIRFARCFELITDAAKDVRSEFTDDEVMQIMQTTENIARAAVTSGNRDAALIPAAISAFLEFVVRLSPEEGNAPGSPKSPKDDYSDLYA